VEGEFDDAIVESIEQFIPYRNEAIQIFFAIAQYYANEEIIRKVHRFFESLIHYMYPPDGTKSYSEWDFDNYKFIIHELFLYANAILIKYEQFKQVSDLLSEQYFVDSSYREDVMLNYAALRQPVRSFRHRNQRLNLRRLSIRADFLNKRISGTGLEFRHLMQADFVLFMRNEIDPERHYWSWWPETLLYAGRMHGPFEIFARAKSKAYFEKVKCLLSIEKPENLKELLESYSTNTRKPPTWDGDSVNPAVLLGYEDLATIP
jgi:hypothetical protein